MPKATAKAKTAKRKTATRKPIAKAKPVRKAKPVYKTRPAARAKAKSAAAKLVRAAKPRRKAAARRKPAPAAQPKTVPRQKFNVSHLDSSEFKREGLRPYAAYRDLGMVEATNGMVLAHVIRMLPPCTDEVRKRHYHDVQLQMVYVLKGWMKNEFEGEGEHLMREGSCWIQPAQIRHTVLDYSDDCEVLEIVMPAEFATAEV
jgi:mannose-6-phosphate isomerase-like protein (cupin superfamily)